MVDSLQNNVGRGPFCEIDMYATYVTCRNLKKGPKPVPETSCILDVSQVLNLTVICLCNLSQNGR
jgi:hypothetical protein